MDIGLDTGGILWFLVDVIFVAILGAALVYGTIQWQRVRKNRTAMRLRDEATERNYQKDR